VSQKNRPPIQRAVRNCVKDLSQIELEETVLHDLIILHAMIAVTTVQRQCKHKLQQPFDELKLFCDKLFYRLKIVNQSYCILCSIYHGFLSLSAEELILKKNTDEHL